MAILRPSDIPKAKEDFIKYRELLGISIKSSDSDPRQKELREELDSLEPMAVRYTLSVLERAVPGPHVEVRVPPWGAIKIFEGPASDPHNLTPPDVVEIDSNIWLSMACGFSSWDQELDSGHIDLSDSEDNRIAHLLPIKF